MAGADAAMSAFATTRWSLVLAARADDVQASAALAELCAQYRAPVLAEVRRAGHQGSDAEDLTQAFFVRFLERRGDHHADPARGRFRQLLRVQLRHFLIDSHAAAMAAKRGGGQVMNASPEIDYVEDLGPTPDLAFDRAFALCVIERALSRLREEASSPARRDLFAALAPSLFEPRDQGALKVIAQAHGLRVNTLAVTLKRLRDRLATLIRAELAELVSDPAAIDEEMRALRAALRAS
jgi:RNA polymerase sigma-70 factor (ECF subfamily)